MLRLTPALACALQATSDLFSLGMLILVGDAHSRWGCSFSLGRRILVGRFLVGTPLTLSHSCGAFSLGGQRILVGPILVGMLILVGAAHSRWAISRWHTLDPVPCLDPVP